MKSRNWRDVTEIVGIISIVVGLILVAWEVRQANNIAKSQMVLDLATQANEFNSATYGNPDVANLLTAISDPDFTGYSETQKSMINGTARHLTNIFWSAQKAYDSGLLGDDDIMMYQSSLAWHLENLPGLKTAYIAIYKRRPGFEGCTCSSP